MLRLNQRLIRFSIINPKIVHSSHQVKRDRALDLVQALNYFFSIRSSVCEKPDQELCLLTSLTTKMQAVISIILQTLTLEMMDELFRFLNSYHNDNSIDNIWIQNRGNIFSAGLSLYELKNNPEYIDRLFRLIAMVAKQNKPIISYCTGSVRNVGAYILSMSAFVLTDNRSVTLRIDEVSKGFVPLGGGTYRLSRLPANIGMFLAITGLKLNANQMSRLGFIHGISKQGVTSKMMRHQITKSNLFFNKKLEYNTFDSRDKQAKEWNDLLIKKKHFEQQTRINQSHIVNSQQSVFSKFAMNQYRLAQVQFHNTAKNPYNSFSDKPGRNINNYYMLRHKKAIDYLEEKDLIELSNFQNIRLPSFPLDKIDKVFGQATLKQAIELLKQDDSNWATDTLNAIQKMDPLAASVTYEMLRKAEGLSWDQCLQMQYTVGKRMLEKSQLHLIPTVQGSKYIFKNQHSQQGIQSIYNNISFDQINSFFLPAQTYEEKLQLDDVKEYSLYPTNDFKHIPDSARMMMNKQFFNDMHLPNQQKEAQRYIFSQKIDYRHKSYEIDSLREKIYMRQESQKIRQRETKRIEAMVNDSKILRNFIQQKEKYIDSMSKQELFKLINDTIVQVFNNGLEKRFDGFKKTAEILGTQNKLKIFKNLRKVLVNSVVLNGSKIQQLNSERNYKFKGPLYFDKDGKSYLESSNPHVQANPALNKLMTEQIGKNMEISEEYTQNEGTQVLKANLGHTIQNQEQKKTWFEKHREKVYKNIIKRYENDRPYEWDSSFVYIQLVTKAAETSQELAQYLGWTNKEFFTTIVNQPATDKTFNLLGTKMLQSMQKVRQKQKDALKEIKQASQRLTEQILTQKYDIYDNKKLQPQSKSSVQQYKTMIEAIIPQKIFPEQMKAYFMKILLGVLNHFMDKYFDSNLQNLPSDLGGFDEWISQRINQSFASLYKWDIQYTFSYLAILRLKEILMSLQEKKDNDESDQGSKLDQAIIIKLNQNQLNFRLDEEIKSVNKIIAKFMYCLLDMHTRSKAKLRLPQTKLLEFMNRVKINRQTDQTSDYPLSFESILLMIGKDRSKIYNKVLNEYLPSEPQFLMEIANSSYEKIKEYAAQFQIKTDMNYVFENDRDEVGKKSLVKSYVYYLMKFDSLVQKATGKYNFLNEEILSYNPVQTKKIFSQILNMSETNKHWVERITRQSIERMFEARLEIEKNLTAGQLKAFDEDMKHAFQPELFRAILKHKINLEISETKKLFGKTRHIQGKRDDSDQSQQLYCSIRRAVKNPEAFRRFNNLHMATKVRDQRFKEYSEVQQENRTNQQIQEMAEEKLQFGNYQRFPPQTLDRMMRECMELGPQKQFEPSLKIRGQQQIRYICQQHFFSNNQKQEMHKKMIFEQDEKDINKKDQITDYDQELYTLKQMLIKDDDKEKRIERLYKRLDQLL